MPISPKAAGVILGLIILVVLVIVLIGMKHTVTGREGLSSIDIGHPDASVACSGTVRGAMCCPYKNAAICDARHCCPPGTQCTSDAEYCLPLGSQGGPIPSTYMSSPEARAGYKRHGYSMGR